MQQTVYALLSALTLLSGTLQVYEQADACRTLRNAARISI